MKRAAELPDMRLPAYRRALSGRTWPRTWSAGEMDPIERHSRPEHQVGRFIIIFGCALFASVAGFHFLARFV